MPDVKRIAIGGAGRADDRGWVVDTLCAVGVAPGALGDVHVVSLSPGAVRGNHYHPASTEWMLVWGGRARLLWGPADGTGHVRPFEVDGHEPVLFEIPEGVTHALQSLDDRTIYALCLSDSPKPETRRSVLHAEGSGGRVP